MFKELASIIKDGTSISLKISQGQNGILKVAVVPMTANVKEPGLAKPLLISDTPEALDLGFAAAIANYQEARTSLAMQVQATIDALDKAKDKQSNKQKTAAKKSGPSDDSVASQTEDDGDEADESSTAPSTTTPAPANAGTDLSALLG